MAPDNYNGRMTTRFLIDGMLSGTGVRDVVNGGYVEPIAIGLSAALSRDVAAWQQKYEDAHFAGFTDDLVNELDKRELLLASRAESELGDGAVGYFSNGRMKHLT